MEKQKTNYITQKDIKELIFYDYETGKAFWKERGEKWFKETTDKRGVKWACKVWNSKYSGKEINAKSDGYITASILKTAYRLHRLIWLYHYGKMPSSQIDHENHDRSDNRISNLKEVSHLENGRNQKKASNNKSGVTGVNFDTRLNKWLAQIMVNRKKKHLGCFVSKEEAIKARKDAEVEYKFHENHGR